MSGEDIVAFDAEEELDIDDNAPDWSQFEKLASHPSNAFIPRRGDKDFTPNTGDSRQQNALQKARNDLFAAISIASVRTRNLRNSAPMVWYDDLGRGSMDENGTVQYPGLGRWERQRKRREYLPEEVIWLMDRGQVEVWKQEKDGLARMSLQQVFSVCIGVDGLTLERYHVYAHLKRFGYTIVRPNWHNTSLDEVSTTSILSAPSTVPTSGPPSAFHSVFNRIFNFFNSISLHSSVHRTWGRIYTSLRIPTPSLPLISGSLLPVNHHLCTFFHVYRPSTIYLQNNPPSPDWFLAVVSSRQTRLPTPSEFSLLFSQIPLTPTPTHPSVQQSWSSWLLQNFGGFVVPPKWRNVVGALKTGRRSVLLAIVDSGVISWLRVWEVDGGSWEIIEGEH